MNRSGILSMSYAVLALILIGVAVTVIVSSQGGLGGFFDVTGEETEEVEDQFADARSGDTALGDSDEGTADETPTSPQEDDAADSSESADDSAQETSNGETQDSTESAEDDSDGEGSVQPQTQALCRFVEGCTQ